MKKILTHNWTLGFLFGAGILIAGSDGAWFPWANLIGVVMFGLCGLLANWAYD